MKRHKSLYTEICAFENLLLAAAKARRGKRSNAVVARFHHNLEGELFRLQGELLDGSYAPGPYRTFTVVDTKRRYISAAPYRDRIVHHAVCNIVEPIFDRSFIHDSYASRSGKGTHAAIDRLTRFMRHNDYVLKCDLRKYFPSIDHEILKETVRRKIGCRQTLRLIDTIIDHSNPQEEIIDYHAGDDLFTPIQRRRGLPIGNQTSQFLANVYLNPFDHYVIEQLGCRSYIRYVDDMVVLGDDKGWLWDVRDAMADYLSTRLRLRLHDRKQYVLPVTAGPDFLGLRVFPEHRRLRRVSAMSFARRLRWMRERYAAGEIQIKEVRQRIAAWLGHASNADTHGLRTSLLGSAVFRRA
jgi:retron-type reverse transcriptase